MTLTQEKEVLNLKAIAGEVDFQHRHIELAKYPVFQKNAEKGNYHLWLNPGGGCQAGFNFNQGYVDDPEIYKWTRNADFRHAISYALDRDEVNQSIFLGLGKTKNGFFMASNPFYDDIKDLEMKYVEYNPDLANKMLDDVGLDTKDGDGWRLRDDGKPLILRLTYITEYFTDEEGVATLVQKYLAAVGIKSVLDGEDVTAFDISARQNKHMMDFNYCTGGKIPETPTNPWGTFNQIGVWYQSHGTSGVAPYTDNIKRLIEIYEEALPLMYSERKALYQEAYTIHVNEQYNICLVCETPAFNGVVVQKNNLVNIPRFANDHQNPGLGRPEQWFFENGLNDAGY